MFRKIIIALTATAALSTVALAPTSASAGGGGHGFGHGFGGHGLRGGFGITIVNPTVDCVTTYQWMQTRRGTWIQVPVNSCDY